MNLNRLVLIFILISIILFSANHLIAASRKSSVFNYHLGLQHYYHGEYDAAYDKLKLAIESNPYYAEAYYHMALVLDKIGDVEAAMENLKSALKIKPKYRAARDFYRKLKKRYELRKSIKRKRLKTIRMNDEEFRYEKLQSREKEGRRAKDYVSEEEKIRMAAIKQSEDALRNKRLKENLIQAEIYLEQEKYTKALSHYEKIVNSAPGNWDARYKYAFVLYKTGQLNKAIIQYKKVIALNKSFGQAYYDLGYIYFALNLYEKSLNTYKKAAKLNPDSEQVLFYTGLVYEKMEDYGRAIDYYKEALSLNPDYVEALEKIEALRSKMKFKYFQMGRENFEKKDWEKAVANFDLALSKGILSVKEAEECRQKIAICQYMLTQQKIKKIRTKNKKEELKKFFVDVQIDREDLVEHSDKYVGKTVHFKGRVVRVEKSAAKLIILINIIEKNVVNYMPPDSFETVDNDEDFGLIIVETTREELEGKSKISKDKLKIGIYVEVLGEYLGLKPIENNFGVFKDKPAMELDFLRMN